MTWHACTCPVRPGAGARAGQRRRFLASADDALLRLRAWAINLNNGARTNTVDIVIQRWSTPEEIEKLRGVMIEDPA